MTISKELAKKYTPEAIAYEIADHDLIADEYCHAVSEAVSLLPYEVIDYVIDNLVVIAGGPSDFAHYWGLNDIRFEGRTGFIILESCLFEQESIGISFTIAHEIAHAWNKDGIDDDIEWKAGMTREVKADKQAIEWLKKRYKIKDLKKCCRYLGNKELKKHKFDISK